MLYYVEDRLQHFLRTEGNLRCIICLFPRLPGTEIPDPDAVRSRVSLADIEASARRGCDNCAILATSATHWSDSSQNAAFWSDIPPNEGIGRLELCTSDPHFLRPRYRTGAPIAHPIAH